jgi:hypothetical protein
MSKDTYYEMCSMLGTEPIYEEIPVEFEDLSLDTQEAFVLYQMLQDNFDSMSGTYQGKNYSGLLDILELNEVEDKKLMFTLIRKIDECRSKAIKASKPTKSAP